MSTSTGSTGSARRLSNVPCRASENDEFSQLAVLTGERGKQHFAAFRPEDKRALVEEFQRRWNSDSTTIEPIPVVRERGMIGQALGLQPQTLFVYNIY